MVPEIWVTSGKLVTVWSTTTGKRNMWLAKKEHRITSHCFTNSGSIFIAMPAPQVHHNCGHCQTPKSYLGRHCGSSLRTEH